ncbi:MAG: CPBP family intramembrane glutamic endopeptidase [Phycisphaerae bacterium]
MTAADLATTQPEPPEDAASRPTADYPVRSRRFLLAEFGLLFLAGPLLFFVPLGVALLAEAAGSNALAAEARSLRIPPIPLLVAVCVYALVVLLRDPSFDRKRLWRGRCIRHAWPGLLLLLVPLAMGVLLMEARFGSAGLPYMPTSPGSRALVLGASALVVVTAAVYTAVRLFREPRRELLLLRWPGVVLLFVPGAVALLAGVWLLEPARLFYLPMERPVVWLVVMTAYPLVSVWPQELLYRTFFFHRYETVLGGRWPTLLLSAATFGWMHVLFLNWVAVVLTLIGGLIFAWRYDHTRSTLAVSVEHALYGQWIFTIGLGWYFFSGARQIGELAAGG